MGKNIIVASGKGGSGTTTLVTNIAAALAASGSNVLIVDMNIGLRNDDIYLGMENKILFDLGDVVSGLCSLEKAIIGHDNCDSLYLLPCPQFKGITGFSGKHVIALLEQLRSEYDYVFVDCPLGIGRMLESIAKGCDKALLVVTPDYLSVRNTDAVSQRLASVGLTNRCFVINRVTESTIDGDLSLEWISKNIDLPLAGMISEDENIHNANNDGSPIVLNGSSFYSKTFIEIAERVVCHT